MEFDETSEGTAKDGRGFGCFVHGSSHVSFFRVPGWYQQSGIRMRQKQTLQ